MDLSRQSKLVPEDKINQYTVKVFGVGSIGSHFTEILAKTGFANIEVYDMDTVEEANIGPQAYDNRHLDMIKVDAMKAIVKDSTGFEIATFNGEVTEATEITPEPDTVYACFFDSFPARKLVFDKVKDYPGIFLDGRIGRYDMRHYLIDLSDKEAVVKYEKTLTPKTESELVCGEKASAPINAQIAGKLVMNLVNFIRGADYVTTFIGNVAAPSNDINVIKQREVVVEDVISQETSPPQEEEIVEPSTSASDILEQISPETDVSVGMMTALFG
jgi:molybdopterin/thiamine biosynthesis adenylyltransferase